ncbi:MAG: prepilin-type N-terminal cleavage/methylation domain-containing protein [Desulfobulbaceae bacterium]|nr:prepilin-type N-terminal cleavage/methylation domain-containing protein [Desulfobulbaceae bacterium]MCK5437212.1 prepilin-type N-terminal cleavage/methylation domain-containing protein [Desulfobulbaceae bacterium]
MPPYSRLHMAGFTLIELVMTILILGSVSLILIPFFNSIIHGSDPIIRQRAVSLGQAMMDEICGKRWDENTPVGGGAIVSVESFVTKNRGGIPLTGADPVTAIGTEEGSRTDYDDVDDYNGLSETDTFSDQLGGTFTWTGYSRTVSVDYIASDSSPIDENTPIAGGTTDSKRIVVNVTTPLQETFTFVAVRCNI